MNERKRTFFLLRLMILAALKERSLTINQISNNTGINWRTVDNHIVYLLGTGYVRQVVFCDYVKIVEITQEGRDYLVVKEAESRLSEVLA